MENYIVIGILVLIAVGAALYIYKEKKKGNHCIGCPSGKQCSGSCSSCGSKSCGTKNQ